MTVRTRIAVSLIAVALAPVAGCGTADAGLISVGSTGTSARTTAPAAPAATTPATTSQATTSTTPTTAPTTAGAPHHLGQSSRLDEIRAAGVMTVCTTGDYRPFTYLDPATDEYTGIDITMAQNLADSLDVDIAWVKTSWPTLMEDTINRCDIAVGGISINTARAQRAFFSAPIIEEGKTPITLCENVEKYDTIEEINQPGVRSITPIGGTNEKFADAHYPQGTIIRWDDNNTIFDQIIAGEADVMTTDASETVWVAKTHPELCAVHPDEPFDYFGKGYLLPRGDVVFKKYVDVWLTMAKKGGTWDAATEPWFGDVTLD